MTFLAAADPEALLSPEAAAKLVLMRRKARVRFEDFMLYWIIATRSPIIWGWHISYLCDIMQCVAEREEEFRFLNINIPPRFLKSTILSQLWQSWMIGVQDSARSSLFSISSSATLAGRDSRRTLDTVRSEWYRALFPKVLIGQKETEAEWETKAGAYRIACGREGTVTGRGAHHLLVDDLVSAQEGDSEVIREQANEFLGKTLRSRLDDQKTGTITNIQQRLHERDATGVLTDLAKIPGGDVYRTISLPNEAEGRTVVTLGQKLYAVREDGDLLHPVYLGKRETLALKASQRRNYDGQYQQHPSKMEGGHIDPRRILRIQGSGIEIKSKLGLTPNFYLDFAGTEKKSQKDDPDFNVIHVVARDQLRRLIHLDIWKKQTADYGEMSRILLKMAELWRPRFIKGEKGGMFNLFMPALRTQMILTGKFITLEPLPARSVDKIGRSMSYQAEVNAGMVAAPQEAPWFLDYEAQCRAFPNGAHDDCHPGHTCVLTDRGQVRIDEVTINDRVWTRNGWRRVLRAWCKGNAKVITRFGMTATPDHPIWTETRGWVSLAELRADDTLLICKNPSSSTASGSPATLTAPVGICESTSIITTPGRSRRSCFTDTSGQRRKGRSRRNTTFITGMETLSTTPCPILSACPARNITRHIPRLSMVECSDISNPSDSLRPAHNLDLTLSPSIAPTRGSVASSRKRTSARNAEARSRGQGCKSHADASASSLETPVVSESAVPVYNLTVERDHEFVADGVLVSNCLEGGFDAAMDNMQLGEVPTVSPTDPNVILSDEIKERLQKRIDEERDVDGDRDSW